MKREITYYIPHTHGCCPGHDLFPTETYKNRRSKKARARGKKLEHKMARHFSKEIIKKEVNFLFLLYTH